MKKICAFFRSLSYRASFFQKILIICVTLVLFAIGLLGSYCLFTMRAFTYDQAKHSFDEVSDQVSQSLSDRIYHMQFAGQLIATNNSLLQGLQDLNSTPWSRYSFYQQTADPTLLAILANHYELSSLTLYQDNPLLVTHSDMIRSLDEVRDQPWVQDVMTQSPQWRVADGKLHMYQRMPRLYPEAPTVLLDVCMTSSVAFNFSLRSYSEYALAVFDDQGTLLWLDDYLSDASTMVLVASAPSDSTSIPGYYVRWTDVAAPGWKLATVLPSRLLTVSSNQITMLVIAVIVLALLLSFVLAILFFKPLVRHIQLLNDSMKLVAKGDLDVSLPTVYQDEIGLLTQQFNQMVMRLKESKEELLKTERREQEAELKALQAQINPHFLYNTLSLIGWKAMAQGATQVAGIVRTFSLFCRTVLNRGKSESYIRDEIQNVSCYVDIQLEMHEQSFDVAYSIPEAFEDCIVPNFVLQPLVENAIVHGIEKLRDQPGLLRIEIREVDGDLHCMVFNNGGVFEEQDLQEVLSDQRKSYGLRNIQERVQYLYGKDYGLFIGTPEGDYTTCVILKLKKTCSPVTPSF